MEIERDLPFEDTSDLVGDHVCDMNILPEEQEDRSAVREPFLEDDSSWLGSLDSDESTTIDEIFPHSAITSWQMLSFYYAGSPYSCLFSHYSPSNLPLFVSTHILSGAVDVLDRVRLPMSDVNRLKLHQDQIHAIFHSAHRHLFEMFTSFITRTAYFVHHMSILPTIDDAEAEFLSEDEKKARVVFAKLKALFTDAMVSKASASLKNPLYFAKVMSQIQIWSKQNKMDIFKLFADVWFDVKRKRNLYMDYLKCALRVNMSSLNYADNPILLQKVKMMIPYLCMLVENSLKLPNKMTGFDFEIEKTPWQSYIPYSSLTEFQKTQIPEYARCVKPPPPSKNPRKRSFTDSR